MKTQTLLALTIALIHIPAMNLAMKTEIPVTETVREPGSWQVLQKTETYTAITYHYQKGGKDILATYDSKTGKYQVSFGFPHEDAGDDCNPRTEFFLAQTAFNYAKARNTQISS